MDTQHLRRRSQEEDLVRRSSAGAALALALAIGACVPAFAQGTPQTGAPSTATFVYVSREIRDEPRRSLAEPVSPDFGWQGARFALAELNANGQFLGQGFDLRRVVVPPDQDLKSVVEPLLRGQAALIVSDLEASDLLALADLAKSGTSVILDARASDDRLRDQECRANVFHVLPSWAMRAGALGRFLAGRGWTRWMLLAGGSVEDRDYAAALRAVAPAVGATIVAGASLPGFGAETSLTQAQVDERIRSLTHIPQPYDLVLVTDTRGAVGERVMFNTAAARLVAGTQGLRATAWDPQFRDFAARGFGYRFTQLAGREMTERDYASWLAVTIYGEAVLRGHVHEPAEVRAFLRSDRLSVAAFKGQPLKFRAENQQLRQPLLLFADQVLVALAPEEDGERATFHCALDRPPTN